MRQLPLWFVVFRDVGFGAMVVLASLPFVGAYQLARDLMDKHGSCRDPRRPAAGARVTEQPGVQERLERMYAERILLASDRISDERARAFRAVFTIRPWGPDGWDLENIKRALAAAEDPEVVGAIVSTLATASPDPPAAPPH
jgi:hypothetical protein